MGEMTFTLHNPLTEEEWDIIEDVDFDHTNSITFHTKHGKDVVFVKRKTGHWIVDGHHIRCDRCGASMCNTDREGDPIPREFCPNCGARMEG